MPSKIFGREHTNTTTPTVSMTTVVDDGTNNFDIALSDFLKFINGLTEDTAPDVAADYIATFDASTGTVKKVLLRTTNRIVQAVHTQTGAVATGTTIIPVDDTIPQNTEGNEYMTLAITPTNASNKLVIEVIWIGSNSVASQFAVALFQDAVANALAVSTAWQPTAAGNVAIPLRHEMVAGTTSAITFKIRAGGHAAGTTTFNGFSAGRIYGGVLASSIRITEVKV